MVHGESKGKTGCTQEVYVRARGFGSRVIGDPATFATINIIRSPRSRAGSPPFAVSPGRLAALPRRGKAMFLIMTVRYPIPCPVE
jgi:hypothetical protein